MMNTMRTFFLPSSEWHEPFRLQGQEAQHLVKSLRLPVGEEVRLLDGQGREGFFRIAYQNQHTVFLDLLHIVSHEKPSGRCTLALGYMRDIRRSWLLEKSVELEAEGLWFWQADRSQTRVPDVGKKSWQAQMEAGAKQCLNPWLPEVRTFPGGIRELLMAGSSFARTYTLRASGAEDRLLCSDDLGRQGSTLFILGPEGGFSSRELAFLEKHSCPSVSLGRRVLRWESAALLCLGLCWWHRQ
jgi:16S rRNA (uracil1498-N3)-methyltransferase